MKLFGLVFIIALFGFGVVMMRIEINRSGRTISQLQNEVEVKEARNQYLQLEISRVSSPGNITRQAEEKLGMVPAKPHEIVVLEDK